MSDPRPDPDALLARVKAEEGRSGKGRLKVFLGACAGVGKTYAMLEAAQERRGEGVDVLVGIVETHGRKETEALLEGLAVLPRRELEYKGVRLREFDLEAALARKPSLILVDELAHTNAPGSRHAKRWQDVKELLDNGVDVYTTLNVQHIESHNDVVAQVTGVVVQETVPDAFVEKADVIEVVDLPFEELLKRLREGKVYLPAQAERAQQSFFKPANLSALRELALRFTAEKVNREVETFRKGQPGAPTWPTVDRLLVLVGPSPSSMNLIRRTCRLATTLRCEWLALHVETPAQLRLPQEDRDGTVQHLRLAEKLGAEAATVHGTDLAEAILVFARERNVTRVIVGKPTRRRWRDVFVGSFVDELVRRSGDIDVVVTRGDPEGEARRPAPSPSRKPWDARPYAASVGVVALLTLICASLTPLVAQTNLAMLYLLGVIVVAARWGRGPSILAAFLSVLAFDFFFVPPRLSFNVADTQYLFTFLVMLLVGVVISTLTVRLRNAVEASRLRERHTASLHALSRKLAGSRGQEAILRATVEHVAELFESQVAVLLPDAKGRLVTRLCQPPGLVLDAKEQAVAQWAYDLGQMAGKGTDTLPSAELLYIPLLAAHGTMGALGLKPADPGRLLIPDQLRLLEALAQQAALALEVDRLSREGDKQQVEIETERLRNAILSSVSHDLRTPLAAITGAASSLLEPNTALSEDSRRELLQTIYEEADRLALQVGNLLEMTRIQAGHIKVRRELQPLEETIGAACRRLERQLKEREVKITVPPDLPLVPADGVLLEQVFFNLLENATKYTPARSPLEVAARVQGQAVAVEVSDHGPGLGEGEEERVFEKFYRGQARGSAGGAGLGLPICKGIIAAHGGRIWAENRSGGGAVFRFTLPLDVRPVDVPPTQG